MKMAAKKPITKEELENLRLRFKFNDSILEILNKKYKKPLTYRKTYKKIKKLEKPSTKIFFWKSNNFIK